MTDIIIILTIGVWVIGILELIVMVMNDKIIKSNKEIAKTRSKQLDILKYLYEMSYIGSSERSRKEALHFVQESYRPEQVFDPMTLEDWAERNGYQKVEGNK